MMLQMQQRRNFSSFLRNETKIKRNLYHKWWRCSLSATAKVLHFFRRVKKTKKKLMTQEVISDSWGDGRHEGGTQLRPKWNKNFEIKQKTISQWRSREIKSGTFKTISVYVGVFCLVHAFITYHILEWFLWFAENFHAPQQNESEECKSFSKGREILSHVCL